MNRIATHKIYKFASTLILNFFLAEAFSPTYSDSARNFSLAPMSAMPSDIITPSTQTGTGQPEELTAEALLERYLAERKEAITENDREVMLKVFRRNLWALSQGLLEPGYIFRAYFGGPHGAVALLREKVAEGLKTWSELLLILELYPRLFERIYIDLDDTLFTPKGYVGGEEWFLNEMRTYDKTTGNMRAQKLHEERQMLSANFFKTVEPDLAERLAMLKEENPDIKLIGLTDRNPLIRPETEKALSQLGIDIPVIYAGSLGRKKAQFITDFEARKKAVELENGNRLKETRANLAKRREKRTDEEFEEWVRENTELVSRGIWTYIDNRISEIISKRQITSLADEEQAFALGYQWEGKYDLQGSKRQMEGAIQNGATQEAACYAVDVCALMKQEGDIQNRLQAYIDIEKFVREANDDRLTMAYIESVTDFLAKRMDEGLSDEERRKILDIYFGRVAPNNKDLWIDSYIKGEVSARQMEYALPGIQADGNYEWVIDKANIYLFLEPLLRYLKEANPDVLLLPDTGARPFKGLMEYFIKGEGLKTKVVIFPISRNAASDTLYEVKRWMKLLKREIRPIGRKEERLIQALRGLSNKLKDAKSVLLLDDNLTSGETVTMIGKY